MFTRFRLISTMFLTAGFAVAAEPTQNDQAAPPPEPDPVVRHASVTIAGRLIDYKVTAAKLALKREDGKTRASVFHVTYERTGVPDVTNRPVVFAFNGGPGSSAIWLHLGALGPRRVPTTPDGLDPLPPARSVIANPQSILDAADLVFVDPVSTGYSRPAKEAKASEFHGLEEDIASMADFVRRWVTEHGRWASPKFLLGESYGGVRVVGLARHLQRRYGMSLNGIVLLSSLLDFRTLHSAQGDNLYYAVYLPAFTAVAHHHGRVRGDRKQLVAQARRFAFGDYSAALLKGAEIKPATRRAVARRLSELTGLGPGVFLENNLRVRASRFRKELLRRQGLVVGRFDGRVAWPAESVADDYPSYDPSFSAVYGAFSTAMLDYLTRNLGWLEHNPYEVLSKEIHPWNWGTENSYVNVSDRLTAAMRHNPRLEVLVLCGRTDLATPPDAIAYSVRHLFDLPGERRRSIRFEYYDAGHMFYLNQPDLLKLRRDLLAFLAAPEPAKRKK